MAKTKKAITEPGMKKLKLTKKVAQSIEITSGNSDFEVEETVLTASPLKKKKIKKQKKIKKSGNLLNTEWCEESVQPDEPFCIDKLRNTLEEDEHWELRRAFMEKNQDVLSPEELVCMAQVYMNIQLLGCTYPRETMEQVNQLAEGIGGEYHSKRAFMLKRTFVSASDAAACKVRRDDPSSILEKTDKPNTNGTQKGSSGPKASQMDIPTEILNCLRSDLIILNDMRHTMLMFNQVNNSGLKMEARVTSIKHDEFEASVDVGGVEIAKTSSATRKLAMRSVLEQAKAFLSKYCYSVIRKKNATEVAGIEVVSKSTTIDPEEAEDNEEGKLPSDNLGFQLLAKLGWKGGSLGTRGDGIVNPVTVDQKFDRKGLGNPVPSTNGKLDRGAIRKKLAEFQKGNIGDHCIVFSNEYSKDDRVFIHKVAQQLKLKSQSYGQDKLGDRRLVVSRKVLRPCELLRKIMVEKDPTFCEMYEVTAPAK